MGLVTIGCDIGQKRDPTAIAVADVAWRRVENTVQDMHTIRHLERLPLGTPYPEVAKRIDAVVKGVRQRGPVGLSLYVGSFDETDVGVRLGLRSGDISARRDRRPVAGGAA